MFENGFPKHWSTLKKLIWLVGSGVAGSSAVIKTVKGAIVHILDALAKPAISLVCEINPVQDLHGQDAPYPAGGGKNKFPITLTTTEKNGTTFMVASDGSITVSGTPSETTRVTLNSLSITPETQMRFSMTGSETGVRVFCQSVVGGTTTYPTMSPGTNLTIGTTYSSFLLEVGTTFNGTAVTLKMQLEDGSSATAWSPYSNICPISGWTGCEVEHTGKNQFDINRVQGTPTPSTLFESPRVMETNKWYKGIRADNYYYDSYANCTIENGVLTVHTFINVNYGIGFPISCKPNTTYIISAEQTGCNFSVGCYDKDWNYLSRLLGTTTYVSPLSFTTPNNAEYIALIIGSAVNGEGIARNIQLELGSTASEYQQYQGETIPIDWTDEAGTVYGGNINLTTGLLTKATEPLLFDNSAWSLSGTSFFYKSFSELQGNIVSAYYVTENGVKMNLNNNNGQARIYLGDNPFLSADTDMGALLNGFKLLYTLATPQTYQLDPVTVNLLLGENNLWHDANGNTELTYYADGTASTQEALGILLGGAYHNPGGDDDATDDEALGILLGN